MYRGLLIKARLPSAKVGGFLGVSGCHQVSLSSQVSTGRIPLHSGPSKLHVGIVSANLPTACLDSSIKVLCV